MHKFVALQKYSKTLFLNKLLFLISKDHSTNECNCIKESNLLIKTSILCYRGGIIVSIKQSKSFL
jgi:hypothetical protein